jgi:regulator of sirC expression with transglutaminase-like and TPR domain
VNQPGQERLRAALVRFAEVTSVPASVQLDEAWLALSSVLLPTLDVDVCRAALDELAATCPLATRDGVMTHLFGSSRFRGDRDSYGDWRNSRVDHVLATGLGIPITLSALAIEVGRRVGVRLSGVGMPAHFLVGDPDDADWYADVFNGGRSLDRSGCASLFRQVTGGAASWREDYLQPTPSAAIVVRMLNNLRAAFTRDSDPIRLGLVLRMRAMITSVDSHDEVRRSQAVFN